MIRFPNDPCSTSEDALQGTCYTLQQCIDKGGSSAGNCAEGFGVCCLCKIHLIKEGGGSNFWNFLLVTIIYNANTIQIYLVVLGCNSQSSENGTFFTNTGAVFGDKGKLDS